MLFGGAPLVALGISNPATALPTIGALAGYLGGSKVMNDAWSKYISPEGNSFDYDFGNDIDAVISTQALHHFEPNDKLTLYKKVFDCLKNDGVFVNEDYFADTEEKEKQLFEDYYNLVRGEGKHYDTPLTIEHEIEILKEAGFSKIEKCITDNYKILIAKK